VETVRGLTIMLPGIGVGMGLVVISGGEEKEERVRAFIVVADMAGMVRCVDWWVDESRSRLLMREMRTTREGDVDGSMRAVRRKERREI
jgi:hypothetical protein